MIRTCFTIVLGIGAWLFLAPAANAEDPYEGGLVTRPSPYWGYTRDPYGLHGLADYTRASGEYLNLVQKAAQARERTRAMKLETRKKELEHMKWERNFLWDMRQEEVQRVIQHEEKRARERPPLTEVLAGTSLNWILADLSKESLPIDGVSQTITQEMLNKVNFVATGGNAGLLRQKELKWPVLLQASRLSDSRERVAALLDNARADLKKGNVTEETIRELLTEHKNLADGRHCRGNPLGVRLGAHAGPLCYPLFARAEADDSLAAEPHGSRLPAQPSAALQNGRGTRAAHAGKRAEVRSRVRGQRTDLRQSARLPCPGGEGKGEERVRLDLLSRDFSGDWIHVAEQGAGPDPAGVRGGDYQSPGGPQEACAAPSRRTPGCNRVHPSRRRGASK